MESLTMPKRGGEMTAWEWKQYSACINVDKFLYMELLRWKLKDEYESSWLCGKPVGWTSEAGR